MELLNMHENVKRIRFHSVGLTIIVITLLQLLLISFNRITIIENEWDRLENYAWNTKAKGIDYNVKGGKTIVLIDKNKADMMQSEANGLSSGIMKQKETYNKTLFDELNAKDRQKILEGKFVRKTHLADGQHVFMLYQPLYSLEGNVIGIISARDRSGYYDEILRKLILNIFKVDFMAVFIFGIAFAVRVQKKGARIRKFQYLN